MRKWKTGFSQKLHIAFGSLLLIILGLSWYFYDSVRWFERDIARVVLANEVLQDYSRLAELGLRGLNTISTSVASGVPTRPPYWDQYLAQTRSTLAAIRRGIGKEVAFSGASSDIQELEDLEALEQLVEEVTAAGFAIERLLSSGDRDGANATFLTLREDQLTDSLLQMVEQALADQRIEASLAQLQTSNSTGIVTKLLPIFAAFFIVLTLIIGGLFSGSLTQSINTLQEGARALASGHLGHRIPRLRETEFQRLGAVFNEMAAELLEHRTKLHDVNTGLEAEIEERTRALKNSNNRLAELDSTRRKLLAEITHEFRTPLTVIRGEAEIALRLSDGLPSAHREAFQRIVDQADETTRLVDDLLFMARADAGEPSLKVRPVSLVNTLRTVCENFSARATQEHLSIEHELGTQQVLVMGDPGRLRQVFSILIDNALRYSNPRGTIHVTLSVVGQMAQVAVRDEGIGVTEEEAKHVFERFYRSRSAEAHARGTGLGLPVAKAIVLAHRGKITLTGVKGKGATATVTLPTKNQLRIVA